MGEEGLCLAQASSRSPLEDLRRLAALVDAAPTADPEAERDRLGADHCLTELGAGRLPVFDPDFRPGTAV
eukprot:3863886-Alexandrium_andersonii.AAC.1